MAKVCAFQHKQYIAFIYSIYPLSDEMTPEVQHNNDKFFSLLFRLYAKVEKMVKSCVFW